MEIHSNSLDSTIDEVLMPSTDTEGLICPLQITEMKFSGKLPTDRRFPPAIKVCLSEIGEVTEAEYLHIESISTHAQYLYENSLKLTEIQLELGSVYKELIRIKRFTFIQRLKAVFIGVSNVK